MKRNILFFILLSLACNILAHKEGTHQYLTKEAYYLLKRNVGAISALENHLHTSFPAEDGGPWQLPYISRGAYREDLEDPVYKYYYSNRPPLYGNAAGTVTLASATILTIINDWLSAGVDPFVSTTHFWDADLGDSHITNMHSQSVITDFWMRIPNSYQKMLAYRDGYDLIIDLILYNFPTRADGTNPCPTQRAFVHFKYDSLVDLFINKNLYVTKVTWLDGSETIYNQRIKFTSQHWSSLNDGTYSGFLDNIVFETLGRMCHLLQDLSVPAHVHVDEHGPFSNPDSFEAFMENDRSWDAVRVDQEVGPFISPFISSNPIHFLMYTTAQMADHFGSNGPYEGDGNNIIAGNYSSQEYTFLNNINLSSLGIPTTTHNPLSTSEKQNVRDKMIPQAIRATAGLLYWFAGETGLVFETEGILSFNNTWKDITLTNNVFVPSGITLRIKSTGNVNLSGFYVQSTGGTIIVEDGATGNFAMLKTGGTINALYSPQVAINNSSSGQTIELLKNTTYTANLSITNKSNRTLSGSSTSYAGTGGSAINGTVTLNNADYMTINYLKINNKITVINSDNVEFNEVQSIHSNCYIESNNSNIDLFNAKFNNSQTKGFYGHDAGSADFDYGEIKNKTGHGIYLNFWTTADFTESIFCSNIFDIYATGMCYAQVNNYGYGTFSSSQVGSTVTSSVSYNPYYWRYCGSLAKTSFTEENINDNIILSGDPVQIEYYEALDDLDKIKVKSKDDKEKDNFVNPQKYKSDYENVIKKFKDITEKYPDNNYAILSLDRVSVCYRTLNEYEELLDYIDDLMSDKKYCKLFPNLLNVKKHSAIRQGDYKKAIELSDKIIKEYPTNELLQEIIYGKGLIYKYYMEDFNNSAKMFKQVIGNYQDEMIAVSAKEELESMGVDPSQGNSLSKTDSHEFNISNYPNPFNPSTKINYQLPTEANVKLVIYDITGSIIKTLVSDIQYAGKQEVIWDGTNSNGSRVASGIYLYRFEATSLKDNKQFNKTEKLLLIK